MSKKNLKILAVVDNLAQVLENVDAQLEMENCVFFGTHISNPVGVSGFLPRDKQAIIDALLEGKAEFPQAILDSHPTKGREGMITGF